MNEIHFDFEAFLTIASVVTLLGWLYVKIKLRGQEVEQKGVFLNIVGFGYSFFPVFFFVLVVRTWVFEPFRIPSSSMMPTLLTGDFIYVNKFAYGLKMPVTHDTLIETGHPERGDVIVFRFPKDQSQDYIKRVVGVPGDTVFYDRRTKKLYLNGEAVKQEALEPYTSFYDDMTNTAGINHKSEALGDSEPHMMWTHNGINNPVYHNKLTVPEGHYFVLGDNRDHSSDSRIWGLVPERNLVGEAKFIWMHWRIPHFFEGLKRIGTTIK